MKTWMPSTLRFVMLYASCATQLLGQAPDGHKATSAKPLSFEVVSIKPWNPASPVYPLLARTADGYRTTGQKLVATIVLAYFQRLGNGNMSSAQVTGGPAWLADQYDIQARISETDIAEWQRQGFRPENQPMLSEMLRTTLVERFKLRAHIVQTETDGFKLNVAKGGAKLAPGSSFDPATVKGSVWMSFNDGGKVVSVPEDHPQSNGMTLNHPTFFNASMADLAEWLSFISSSVVQDGTGLTGRYNFVFSMPGEFENDGGPQSFPYYQGLAKLGLKADSAKVPMKKVVIDHIERPTPN